MSIIDPLFDYNPTPEVKDTPAAKLAHQMISQGYTEEQIINFATLQIKTDAARAEFLSAATQNWKALKQNETSLPLTKAAARTTYNHYRQQNLADLALETPTCKFQKPHALAQQLLDGEIKKEDLPTLAIEIPQKAQADFGGIVADYLLERTSAVNRHTLANYRALVVPYYNTQLTTDNENLHHARINTHTKIAEELLITPASEQIENILHADFFGYFANATDAEALLSSVDALSIDIQHAAYEELSNRDNHRFPLPAHPQSPVEKLLCARANAAAFANAQEAFKDDPREATAVRLGQTTALALGLGVIERNKFTSTLLTPTTDDLRLIILTQAKTFFLGDDNASYYFFNRQIAQTLLNLNTHAQEKQPTRANAAAYATTLHEAYRANAIDTSTRNLRLKELSILHPALASTFYRTTANLCKDDPATSRKFLVTALTDDEFTARTELEKNPTVENAKLWLRNFAERCYYKIEEPKSIAEIVTRRPSLETVDELPATAGSDILFAALVSLPASTEIPLAAQKPLYDQIRRHALPALFWRTDFELSDQVTKIKEARDLTGHTAIKHEQLCYFMVNQALSARLGGTISHKTFCDILQRNDRTTFTYPGCYLNALTSARSKILPITSPRLALALGLQIRNELNLILKLPTQAFPPRPIPNANETISQINSQPPPSI